jgi:propanediol dehydratase small subunit
MKPVFDIAVLITVLRQLERRCGKLETEQSQVLEDMPLKQLEALTVALLDFETTRDLTKWIDDRGWEVYEAELAELEKNKPEPKRYVSSIEEIAREKVASNMIKLKVAFSLEEIAELTSVPLEIVTELHAELNPDSKAYTESFDEVMTLCDLSHMNHQQRQEFHKNAVYSKTKPVRD